MKSNEPVVERDCLLFEERVQELLDQRISPLSDCKVAEHAARCPECTQMLQSFWILSQSYDFRTASPTGSDLEVSVATPPRKAVHPTGNFKRIVWSFGPSFAALLLLGIAIFFSSRTPFDQELIHRIEKNRQYQMVEASPSAEDQEIEPFSNRVVRDVKGYSYSLYEIAHATRDWTDPNGKMPSKMIQNISRPLTPIRTYVPTEVSILVQLRHYALGAWRLLNLSLGYGDEWENGDLGWQPIPHDSNVA